MRGQRQPAKHTRRWLRAPIPPLGRRGTAMKADKQAGPSNPGSRAAALPLLSPYSAGLVFPQLVDAVVERVLVPGRLRLRTSAGTIPSIRMAPALKLSP